MEKYYRLEIKIPEECYDMVAGLLAIDAAFGWEEQSLLTGETVFRLHCEDENLLGQIADKTLALCRDAEFTKGEAQKTDWLEAWKDFFTPVECGKHFVILPPWLAHENFGDRYKILIDPKCAFGTGHHATTAICVNALDSLLSEGFLRAGQTFLDLGCGSGVLGIAACLAGLSGIGLDIDPLAISNAKENRALNNIVDMDLEQGSIELVVGKKFDLLMANILARPLMEMAPQICACLRPDSSLVLSGILDIQADAVEKAFRNCGLPEAQRLEMDEWRALLWPRCS